MERLSSFDSIPFLTSEPNAELSEKRGLGHKNIRHLGLVDHFIQLSDSLAITGQRVISLDTGEALLDLADSLYLFDDVQKRLVQFKDGRLKSYAIPGLNLVSNVKVDHKVALLSFVGGQYVAASSCRMNEMHACDGSLYQIEPSALEWQKDYSLNKALPAFNINVVRSLSTPIAVPAYSRSMFKNYKLVLYKDKIHSFEDTNKNYYLNDSFLFTNSMPGKKFFLSIMNLENSKSCDLESDKESLSLVRHGGGYFSIYDFQSQGASSLYYVNAQCEIKLLRSFNNEYYWFKNAGSHKLMQSQSVEGDRNELYLVEAGELKKLPLWESGWATHITSSYYINIKFEGGAQLARKVYFKDLHIEPVDSFNIPVDVSTYPSKGDYNFTVGTIMYSMLSIHPNHTEEHIWHKNKFGKSYGTRKSIEYFGGGNSEAISADVVMVSPRFYVTSGILLNPVGESYVYLKE